MYFQEFRFAIRISQENIFQEFDFSTVEISRVSFLNGSDFSSLFSRVSIFDSDFPTEYFQEFDFSTVEISEFIFSTVQIFSIFF